MIAKSFRLGIKQLNIPSDSTIEKQIKDNLQNIRLSSLSFSMTIDPAEKKHIIQNKTRAIANIKLNKSCNRAKKSHLYSSISYNPFEKVPLCIFQSSISTPRDQGQLFRCLQRLSTQTHAQFL